MSSRAGLLRLVLALIAGLIYAPGLRAGEKGLSWQEESGVIWQSPWAEVRLDLNPEQQGPLLRFLNDGRQVRLEKPTVQKSSATHLGLRYELAPSGIGKLTVTRSLQVQRWGTGQALVETFELVPEVAVHQDVEIIRPFSIEIPEPQPDRQPTSCTLPLKNGWARSTILSDEAVRAEYRLGHWLETSETPELALPIMQVDQRQRWQTTICADPRFSGLFTLGARAGQISGAVRYCYAGSKVPISGVQSRNFAFWLRAAPAPQEPFGKSLDAFFALMLPEVRPGPRWLHEIYMVGYDFLSDDGKGWEQDISVLAAWLGPAERRHVALCLHGWYDALGSYAFDESGRLKEHWVAMERTRHVPFTPAELRRRLHFARYKGFRALLYFGDGLATDSGVPGYHEDWAFRDPKGGKISGWQGPDTFGKTYLMNPAHPEVQRRFLRYLEALLGAVGHDVDGFVWDETFHARAGQIAYEPVPAYCAPAMLQLVEDLTARVKRFDTEKVFLASDCVGIGMGIPGYAMVADGLYQDTHCAPERWPDALFPNWRNVYWSCNWGPTTHFSWTRFGVEEFGTPVAISNGWEEDRGPHEWTTAKRDAFLELFRRRASKGPGHVRFLTEDPRKFVKERKPTDPPKP